MKKGGEGIHPAALGRGAGGGKSEIRDKENDFARDKGKL